MSLADGARSGPAHAVECEKRSRLDDAGKTAILGRMIQARLSSGEFVEYTSVRHGAVHRCLERAIPAMQQDFDSTCNQDAAADIEPLDRIFDSYVASCIP